jgi:hypothetical protein
MLKKSMLFVPVYLLLAISIVFPAYAGHGKETATISVNEGGVAIGGYDTVAYFTESKAMAGSNEFEYTWREAKWHFSKLQHRALFISNPEKYAPQYGAFCALGVSFQSAVAVDPEAWTIVDNKLYLNYTLEFRDKWRMDQEEHIVRANQVWKDHQLPE